MNLKMLLVRVHVVPHLIQVHYCESKDGESFQFLSVKLPSYDDENNIIGVFGCSVVLGKQSPTNETLSERESLCVFHLCKGYTMKETAKVMGLSPKTVETYIDRAKQKFKCRNKAELIAAYLQETR